MYVRNLWYVAGYVHELAPGQVLGRRFLGESVVLFRTENGLLGALEDRCCHRAMPLSAGHVDGEIIRCCYHGFEFGLHGACTRIPGQERIPSQASVRRYPVSEQDGVIWIWMGEASVADLGAIPSHRWHSSPEWAWKGFHFKMHARWDLLVDNLMDLTHLAYVHAATIGGNANLHFNTPTHATREGNQIKVSRYMPNSTPPRTYVDAAGFEGTVDRWQEIEFEPMVVRVNTGAGAVGTGALQGHREGAFGMVVLHGITPESETSTHYIWTIATNTTKPDIAAKIFEQIAVTIQEDVTVLEAQQRCIDETPGGKFVDAAADVASNQARRLVRALLDAERHPAVATG